MSVDLLDLFRPPADGSLTSLTPRCADRLELGPYENGRKARCDLPAGHDGMHSCYDEGRVKRRWRAAS